MHRIYLWIFLLIIVIAGFFRFYQIGTNPPSLTWDEVAWGYNAYSLGIDGKDEFGRFLPHDYLESFGDFKPPVYAYLDILPIKVWGLTEFATRFPSALFGTLTVVVTYFLTRALFYTSKKRNTIALVSMAVLAISPWHIMLSRAAFEANVASFFIVIGMWLYLEALQNKSKLFFVSIPSFIIAMYTFNTSRIVAPLLLIMLSVVFFWKMKDKKVYILALVFGLLLLAPIVTFLLSPQAQLRFKEVNIFGDINVTRTLNNEVVRDGNTKWAKALHNRRFAYAVDFLSHYMDHFDPTYLFISGDGNPKFSLQDVGEMYLWDIPFLIGGIIFLFKKREGQWWVIPVWLLIGIIPAATARETPHALRTEIILPTFQILIAYGVVTYAEIIKKWKSNALQILVGIGCVLFLCMNVFYFSYKLFVQYPRVYSYFWQYGYVDSIQYVKSVGNKYDAISMTDVLGRPYIYYAFYMHILPSNFRETSTVARDMFGFVTVQRIGNIYFGNALPQNTANKHMLYINDPLRVPKGATIQKIFYLKNNEPILEAYTL